MNSGDIIYSERGQQAEFIAKSSRGFIVRPLYESDDEPSYGEVQEWDRVFVDPPTEKWHAEILELDKKARAMRETIDAMRDEKGKLDADGKERMARLKQHKGLELLDLFISGKITHYVVSEHYTYPQIIEAARMTYDDGDRWNKNKPLRLLSLFGKSNGDLTWRMSHYSDGSGGGCELNVFTSKEDALKFLSEYCESQYAAWRLDAKLIYKAERARDGAFHAGLQIPEDVTIGIREWKMTVFQSELDRANAARDVVLKKISDAQSV